MTKTAVILFNLGGPDSQSAVKPFLFNLFSDPAIIRLPQPLRWLVAKLISGKREETAKEIYRQMGGGSPILPNTQAQADALEKILNSSLVAERGDQQETPSPAKINDLLRKSEFSLPLPQGERSYRVFIAMRYWHPFTEKTVREVKNYGPDEIILLPLYPQFSTTTTASSLKAWHECAAKAGLDAPTKALCCYPQESGFIEALAASMKAAFEQAKSYGEPRVLFSAHGLPEKIVKAGDPYAWQCEQTVAALVRSLGISDLDYVLCYQSRVGPMKWIGPATDEEVKRAGLEKKPLIVVPVAFVSEHSETLVEIDKEYRHLAGECGVPHYVYVPTVSTAPAFIEALARLVRRAQTERSDCVSDMTCPSRFSGCYKGAQ